MNFSLDIPFDNPIEYRNIKIYPVMVKDYVYFSTYSNCLTLDKNSIPDAKIISMTNLDYIFKMTEENMEENPYLLWFDRMLHLCLKDEDGFENMEESIRRYVYDEDGRAYFTIGDEKYTNRDFEELKKIISAQNLIELPDETMSKDVRDSLEKARKYKERLSGTKTGSFEDYIISLAVITGWSFEYIYNLSIRKFVKSIERLDNLIHYKIYLGASMSGMVEFKDKSFIKHWLTNLEKENRYSDVSVDLDAVQTKLNLEGG